MSSPCSTQHVPSGFEADLLYNLNIKIIFYVSGDIAGITNLDAAHPDIEHKLYSGSTVGGRIVQ
jgi:hypothetical protein